MNSPLVRVLMATLFTMVAVAVTFVVAGLTIGNLVGRFGMVVLLLVSGVAWWLVGQRLFMVDKRN